MISDNSETRSFADKLSNAAADIILRSSDGTDFPSHKWILAKASDATDPHVIIPFTENAASLELLLSYCYPRSMHPEPSFNSLEDVKDALSIATKYQVDVMREGIKTQLAAFTAGHPERVYALAWLYEMPDLALSAARETLHQPFLEGPEVPEFFDIPAIALHRLQQYQRTCITQVTHGLGSSVPVTWITVLSIRLQPAVPTTACSCGECVIDMLTGSPVHPGEIRAESIRAWWWGYVLRAVEALRESPHSSTVARHELVYPSLVDAGKCLSCSTGRFVEIMSFTAQRLEKEVERIISEVPLKLPF
ncbi:hypothetical protein OF83DRAFT_1177138 [Amylostereum chailletii]|nr:hypothetical protein OF83DRAFT_1177138 [Amylostereum chailletii]